jgi:ABC-type bacteriocin/lantibiotic exporter with double-glycine peptidase domain
MGANMWVAVMCAALAEPGVACGPATLSLAARLVGRPVSRDNLQRAFGGRLSGAHSFSELQAATAALGLACVATRVDPRSPSLVPLPLIVAIRQGTRANATSGRYHFVILLGRTREGVQVLDPPHKPYLMTLDDCAERWDGAGLYVAHDRAVAIG